MKRLSYVILLLSLLSPAVAQEARPYPAQPTQPDGSDQPAPSVQPYQVKKGVVAGIVTKSGSSEPVRKAMVSLHPAFGDASGQNPGSGEHAVTTDANGRFEIRNVEPGDYRVQVQRNGYQRLRTAGTQVWRPSISLTLAPGEEKRDLVLELQPGIVITGKITDENAEPMTGVAVSALQVSYFGKRSYIQVRSAVTDDRGEYRIFDLPSGQYVIQAVPDPPLKNSRKGYPPVYYPNAASGDDAGIVSLNPGSQTICDFSLFSAPTLHIRGHITPAANARVFVRKRGTGFVRGEANVAKDGGFDIGGLFPGEYELIAYNYSEPRRAQYTVQTVRLEGADLNGLELSARAGTESAATIQGRIKLEENSSTHGDLASLVVTLLPEAGFDQNERTVATEVKGDGAFTIANVPGGRYNIHLATSGPGWEDFYTKSLTVSGQDVTDSTFTIPAGGNVPVDIGVGSDGAYVEGVVVDDDGKPVPDAIVVGVPDSPRRGQLDCFQRAVAGPDGTYRLRGIEPGSYSLFAWEAMDDWTFMDPAFLHRYENLGAAIQLNSGDRRTMQLKLLSQ